MVSQGLLGSPSHTQARARAHAGSVLLHAHAEQCRAERAALCEQCMQERNQACVEGCRTHACVQRSNSVKSDSAGDGENEGQSGTSRLTQSASGAAAGTAEPDLHSSAAAAAEREARGTKCARAAHAV